MQLKENRVLHLLFKVKIQSTSRNNGYEGDERHNTKVDRQAHSGEVKITDLVRKHLQKHEHISSISLKRTPPFLGPISLFIVFLKRT
jgi:hypothetical protein